MSPLFLTHRYTHFIFCLSDTHNKQTCCVSYRPHSRSPRNLICIPRTFHRLFLKPHTHKEIKTQQIRSENTNSSSASAPSSASPNVPAAHQRDTSSVSVTVSVISAHFSRLWLNTSSMKSGSVLCIRDTSV